MIFYFTGTGNSKYIADKLAACLDQEVINMGKAVSNGDFTFDCSEEDCIGFVFPTYGYSIPTIVKEFIVNMELDNISDDTYVFAISNSGASEGNSLYEINKMLLNKNINLSYCRNVIFPDNYIVMFNAPEAEEKNVILRSANIKLANIINNILRRKKSLQTKSGIMLLFYKLFNYVFVNLMNKTSKFTVSNNCTGCGHCKDICNSNAIEIEDNKPIWTKNTCVHCMACISRCPVSAIEFGNKTVGKERYVNPLAHFDNSDVNISSTDTDELSKEPVEDDIHITYTENSELEEIINDVEDSIDVNFENDSDMETDLSEDTVKHNQDEDTNDSADA